ncbi:MAG: hypothetical protein ACKO4U_06635 [Caldilinea sp.]
MNIRLDKFTLVVLAVVGILALTAVILVNRSGNSDELQTYRTEDVPETPVYNAFLAFRKGDIATARAQYSSRVLEEVAGEAGYGPLRGESYLSDETARRLRVLQVNPDLQDAQRAYVTVAIDTYATGGLFEGGSTWSSERTVEVIRENETWKINAQEYFY